MKKILFAVVTLVAMVACFSCGPKDSELTELKINGSSKIEMTVGTTAQLSVATNIEKNQGVVFTYTSSDENVVSVDGKGTLLAIALTTSPVTITVKATKDEKSLEATVQVEVIELAQSLKFNELYLMQSTADWEEQQYVVYQIRSYRGVELPDAGDAQLTRVDTHVGDTVGAKAGEFFPAAGEWIYLYDKTVEGETYQIGLFADSVRTYRTWVLSEDVFVADESFTCADQGAVMEFILAWQYDSKYSYVLGDRDFVEDMTATNTIRPAGVEARPMPGYMQIGHFNETEYLDFFTRALNDEEVSMDDYEFFARYDACIKAVFYDEEQEGISVFPMYGYPTAGWVYLDQSTTESWLALSSYEFEATMYSEPGWYALQTEIFEEDGQMYKQFVTPLQMADSKTYTYVKNASNAPRRAPRHSANVNPCDNLRPMANSAMNAQMNITKALGATVNVALKLR